MLRSQRMYYVKRNKQNIEDQIQSIIDSRGNERKLIIISGEYGIGKTALFNEIISMLQYKECLTISLEKGYNNSPVFLKEITTSFIENLKLDDNLKSKGANLFASFLKFFPDISVGVSKNVRLSFSDMKKNIIELIEKHWSTYISQIESIEHQGDYYICELVRIIHSAINICHSDLYVIIDNLDCLDKQTFMFLNMINEKIQNLSVIVTMESKLYDVKNKLSFEFVMNYTRKNSSNRLSKSFSLELFDEVDTKEYISQYNLFCGIEDVTALSEQIYTFSGGLPLFISIVCEDNEFWIRQNAEERDLENIDLAVYYRNLLQKASDERKSILFYFVANDGSIEKDVLNQILKREKNEKLRNAFIELCLLKIIVESPQNCYRIKAPILSNYIEKHVNEYCLDKDTYKKKCLKAYCDLSKSKNISEKYSKIVKLSIELNEYEKAYKYAIEASKNLGVQMKYDTAGSILQYLLKKADLSENQIVDVIKDLLEHLYNNKQMQLLLTYYYSYISQIEKVTFSEIVLANIHLKAAKAHYYLNQSNEAIKTARKALVGNSNSQIYFDANIIIISSYDLQGDYNSCFMKYDDCIEEIRINKDLDPDESLQVKFDMIYQMRTDDVDKCILKLESAITREINKSDRVYACCCNNLGIEYLMDGNFTKAKEYLEKAQSLFLSKFSIEAHFVLNNLGLYYLYATDEKDYEKALVFFHQAYSYAISPLQHAYILMNIANTYFFKKNFSMALV